ncbi:MAG: hypothetical protein M3239_07885, partial [Thermoproteota archaeon]|nr:hypothetical protein [Thermoproteota archaeon]
MKKTTAALVLSMTVPVFATPAAFGFNMVVVLNSEQRTVITNTNHDTNTQQVNSIRVTQTAGNEPEVECEGNLKCEIIGDTVVATSEQNDNTTVTTTMTQSNSPLDSDDINAINQDIAGMVSTIVDRVFD